VCVGVAEADFDLPIKSDSGFGFEPSSESSEPASPGGSGRPWTEEERTIRARQEALRGIREALDALDAPRRSVEPRPRDRRDIPSPPGQAMGPLPVTRSPRRSGSPDSDSNSEPELRWGAAVDRRGAPQAAADHVAWDPLGESRKTKTYARRGGGLRQELATSLAVPRRADPDPATLWSTTVEARGVKRATDQKALEFVFKDLPWLVPCEAVSRRMVCYKAVSASAGEHGGWVFHALDRPRQTIRLGRPAEDFARGFSVWLSPAEALQAPVAVPCRRGLPVVVLRVLVTGRGYCRGRGLYFPRLVAVDTEEVPS